MSNEQGTITPVDEEKKLQQEQPDLPAISTGFLIQSNFWRNADPATRRGWIENGNARSVITGFLGKGRKLKAWSAGEIRDESVTPDTVDRANVRYGIARILAELRGLADEEVSYDSEGNLSQSLKDRVTAVRAELDAPGGFDPDEQAVADSFIEWGITKKGMPSDVLAHLGRDGQPKLVELVREFQKDLLNPGTPEERVAERAMLLFMEAGEPSKLAFEQGPVASAWPSSGIQSRKHSFTEFVLKAMADEGVTSEAVDAEALVKNVEERYKRHKDGSEPFDPAARNFQRFSGKIGEIADDEAGDVGGTIAKVLRQRMPLWKDFEREGGQPKGWFREEVDGKVVDRFNPSYFTDPDRIIADIESSDEITPEDKTQTVERFKDAAGAVFGQVLSEAIASDFSNNVFDGEGGETLQDIVNRMNSEGKSQYDIFKEVVGQARQGNKAGFLEEVGARFTRWFINGGLGLFAVNQTVGRALAEVNQGFSDQDATRFGQYSDLLGNRNSVEWLSGVTERLTGNEVYMQDLADIVGQVGSMIVQGGIGNQVSRGINSLKWARPIGSESMARAAGALVASASRPKQLLGSFMRMRAMTLPVNTATSYAAAVGQSTAASYSDAFNHFASLGIDNAHGKGLRYGYTNGIITGAVMLASGMLFGRLGHAMGIAEEGAFVGGGGVSSVGMEASLKSIFNEIRSNIASRRFGVLLKAETAGMKGFSKAAKAIAAGMREGLGGGVGKAVKTYVGRKSLEVVSEFSEEAVEQALGQMAEIFYHALNVDEGTRGEYARFDIVDIMHAATLGALGGLLGGGADIAPDMIGAVMGGKEFAERAKRIATGLMNAARTDATPLGQAVGKLREQASGSPAPALPSLVGDVQAAARDYTARTLSDLEGTPLTLSFMQKLMQAGARALSPAAGVKMKQEGDDFVARLRQMDDNLGRIGSEAPADSANARRREVEVIGESKPLTVAFESKPKAHPKAEDQAFLNRLLGTPQTGSGEWDTENRVAPGSVQLRRIGGKGSQRFQVMVNKGGTNRVYDASTQQVGPALDKDIKSPGYKETVPNVFKSLTTRKIKTPAEKLGKAKPLDQKRLTSPERFQPQSKLFAFVSRIAGKLKFEPKAHKYTINGKSVVSATTIASGGTEAKAAKDKAMRARAAEIAARTKMSVQAVLDEWAAAAEHGTAFHEHVAAALEGGKTDNPAVRQVVAMVRQKAEAGSKVHVEVPISNGSVAATVDVLIEHADGTVSIVDIKTTAQSPFGDEGKADYDRFNRDTHAAQLEVARRILEENGVKVRDNGTGGNETFVIPVKRGGQWEVWLDESPGNNGSFINATPSPEVAANVARLMDEASANAPKAQATPAAAVVSGTETTTPAQPPVEPLAIEVEQEAETGDDDEIVLPGNDLNASPDARELPGVVAFGVVDQSDFDETQRLTQREEGEEVPDKPVLRWRKDGSQGKNVVTGRLEDGSVVQVAGDEGVVRSFQVEQVRTTETGEDYVLAEIAPESAAKLAQAKVRDDVMDAVSGALAVAQGSIKDPSGRQAVLGAADAMVRRAFQFMSNTFGAGMPNVTLERVADGADLGGTFAVRRNPDGSLTVFYDPMVQAASLAAIAEKLSEEGLTDEAKARESAWMARDLALALETAMDEEVGWHAVALTEFSEEDIIGMMGDLLDAARSNGVVRMLVDTESFRLNGKGKKPLSLASLSKALQDTSDPVNREALLRIGHELLANMAMAVRSGVRSGDAMEMFHNWLGSSQKLAESSESKRLIDRFIEMARRIMSAMRRYLASRQILSMVPESFATKVGTIVNKMEELRGAGSGDYFNVREQASNTAAALVSQAANIGTVRIRSAWKLRTASNAVKEYCGLDVARFLELSTDDDGRLGLRVRPDVLAELGDTEVIRDVVTALGEYNAENDLWMFRQKHELLRRASEMARSDLAGTVGMGNAELWLEDHRRRTRFGGGFAQANPGAVRQVAQAKARVDELEEAALAEGLEGDKLAASEKAAADAREVLARLVAQANLDSVLAADLSSKRLRSVGLDGSESSGVAARAIVAAAQQPEAMELINRIERLNAMLAAMRNIGSRQEVEERLLELKTERSESASADAVADYDLLIDSLQEALDSNIPVEPAELGKFVYGLETTLEERHHGVLESFNRLTARMKRYLDARNGLDQVNATVVDDMLGISNGFAGEKLRMPDVTNRLAKGSRSDVEKAVEGLPKMVPAWMSGSNVSGRIPFVLPRVPNSPSVNMGDPVVVWLEASEQAGEPRDLHSIRSGMHHMLGYHGATDPESAPQKPESIANAGSEAQALWADRVPTTSDLAIERQTARSVARTITGDVMVAAETGSLRHAGNGLAFDEASDAFATARQLLESHGINIDNGQLGDRHLGNIATGGWGADLAWRLDEESKQFSWKMVDQAHDLDPGPSMFSGFDENGQPVPQDNAQRVWTSDPNYWHDSKDGLKPTEVMERAKSLAERAARFVSDVFFPSANESLDGEGGPVVRGALSPSAWYAVEGRGDARLTPAGYAATIVRSALADLYLYTKRVSLSPNTRAGQAAARVLAELESSLGGTTVAEILKAHGNRLGPMPETPNSALLNGIYHRARDLRNAMHIASDLRFQSRSRYVRESIHRAVFESQFVNEATAQLMRDAEETRRVVLPWSDRIIDDVTFRVNLARDAQGSRLDFAKEIGWTIGAMSSGALLEAYRKSSKDPDSYRMTGGENTPEGRVILKNFDQYGDNENDPNTSGDVGTPTRVEGDRLFGRLKDVAIARKGLLNRRTVAAMLVFGMDQHAVKSFMMRHSRIEHSLSPDYRALSTEQGRLEAAIARDAEIEKKGKKKGKWDHAKRGMTFQQAKAELEAELAKVKQELELIPKVDDGIRVFDEEAIDRDLLEMLETLDMMERTYRMQKEGPGELSANRISTLIEQNLGQLPVAGEAGQMETTTHSVMRVEDGSQAGNEAAKEASDRVALARNAGDYGPGFADDVASVVGQAGDSFTVLAGDVDSINEESGLDDEEVIDLVDDINRRIETGSLAGESPSDVVLRMFGNARGRVRVALAQVLANGVARFARQPERSTRDVITTGRPLVDVPAINLVAPVTRNMLRNRTHFFQTQGVAVGSQIHPWSPSSADPHEVLWSMVARTSGLDVAWIDESVGQDLTEVGAELDRVPPFTIVGGKAVVINRGVKLSPGDAFRAMLDFVEAVEAVKPGTKERLAAVGSDIRSAMDDMLGPKLVAVAADWLRKSWVRRASRRGVRIDDAVFDPTLPDSTVLDENTLALRKDFFAKVDKMVERRRELVRNAYRDKFAADPANARRPTLLDEAVAPGLESTPEYYRDAAGNVSFGESVHPANIDAAGRQRLDIAQALLAMTDTGIIGAFREAVSIYGNHLFANTGDSSFPMVKDDEGNPLYPDIEAALADAQKLGHDYAEGLALAQGLVGKASSVTRDDAPEGDVNPEWLADDTSLPDDVLANPVVRPEEGILVEEGGTAEQTPEELDEQMRAAAEDAVSGPVVARFFGSMFAHALAAFNDASFGPLGKQKARQTTKGGEAGEMNVPTLGKLIDEMPLFRLFQTVSQWGQADTGNWDFRPKRDDRDRSLFLAARVKGIVERFISGLEAGDIPQMQNLRKEIKKAFSRKELDTKVWIDRSHLVDMADFLDSDVNPNKVFEAGRRKRSARDFTAALLNNPEAAKLLGLRFVEEAKDGDGNTEPAHFEISGDIASLKAAVKAAGLDHNVHTTDIVMPTGSEESRPRVVHKLLTVERNGERVPVTFTDKAVEELVGDAEHKRQLAEAVEERRAERQRLLDMARRRTLLLKDAMDRIGVTAPGEYWKVFHDLLGGSRPTAVNLAGLPVGMVSLVRSVTKLDGMPKMLAQAIVQKVAVALTGVRRTGDTERDIGRALEAARLADTEGREGIEDSRQVFTEPEFVRALGRMLHARTSHAVALAQSPTFERAFNSMVKAGTGIGLSSDFLRTGDDEAAMASGRAMREIHTGTAVLMEIMFGSRRERDSEGLGNRIPEHPPIQPRLQGPSRPRELVRVVRSEDVVTQLGTVVPGMFFDTRERPEFEALQWPESTSHARTSGPATLVIETSIMDALRDMPGERANAAREALREFARLAKQMNYSASAAVYPNVQALQGMPSTSALAGDIMVAKANLERALGALVEANEHGFGNAVTEDVLADMMPQGTWSEDVIRKFGGLVSKVGVTISPETKVKIARALVNPDPVTAIEAILKEDNAVSAMFGSRTKVDEGGNLKVVGLASAAWSKAVGSVVDRIEAKSREVNRIAELSEFADKTLRDAARKEATRASDDPATQADIEAIIMEMAGDRVRQYALHPSNTGRDPQDDLKFAGEIEARAGRVALEGRNRFVSTLDATGLVTPLEAEALEKAGRTSVPVKWTPDTDPATIAVLDRVQDKFYWSWNRAWELGKMASPARVHERFERTQGNFGKIGETAAKDVVGKLLAMDSGSDNIFLNDVLLPDVTHAYLRSAPKWTGQRGDATRIALRSNGSTVRDDMRAALVPNANTRAAVKVQADAVVKEVMAHANLAPTQQSGGGTGQMAKRLAEQQLREVVGAAAELMASRYRSNGTARHPNRIDERDPLDRMAGNLNAMASNQNWNAFLQEAIRTYAVLFGHTKGIEIARKLAKGSKIAEDGRMSRDFHAKRQRARIQFGTDRQSEEGAREAMAWMQYGVTGDITSMLPAGRMGGIMLGKQLQDEIVEASSGIRQEMVGGRLVTEQQGRTMGYVGSIFLNLLNADPASNVVGAVKRRIVALAQEVTGTLGALETLKEGLELGERKTGVTTRNMAGSRRIVAGFDAVGLKGMARTMRQLGMEGYRQMDAIHDTRRGAAALLNMLGNLSAQLGRLADDRRLTESDIVATFEQEVADFYGQTGQLPAGSTAEEVVKYASFLNGRFREAREALDTVQTLFANDEGRKPGKVAFGVATKFVQSGESFPDGMDDEKRVEAAVDPARAMMSGGHRPSVHGWSILDLNGITAPQRLLQDSYRRVAVAPSNKIMSDTLGTTVAAGNNRLISTEEGKSGTIMPLIHGNGPGSDLNPGKTSEQLAFLRGMFAETMAFDMSEQSSGSELEDIAMELGMAGTGDALVSLTQVWRQTLPGAIGYGIYTGGIKNALYGDFHEATGRYLASIIGGVADPNDDFAPKLAYMMQHLAPGVYRRGPNAEDFVQELAKWDPKSIPDNEGLASRMSRLMGNMLRTVPKIPAQIRRKELEWLMARPEMVMVRMIWADQIARGIEAGYVADGSSLEHTLRPEDIVDPQHWGHITTAVLQRAEDAVADIMAESDPGMKAAILHRGSNMWINIFKSGMFFMQNHSMSVGSMMGANFRLWMSRATSKEQKIVARRRFASGLVQNALFLMMKGPVISTALSGMLASAAWVAAKLPVAALAINPLLAGALRMFGGDDDDPDEAARRVFAGSMNAMSGGDGLAGRMAMSALLGGAPAGWDYGGPDGPGRFDRKKFGNTMARQVLTLMNEAAFSSMSVSAPTLALGGNTMGRWGTDLANRWMLDAVGKATLGDGRQSPFYTGRPGFGSQGMDADFESRGVNSIIKSATGVGGDVAGIIPMGIPAKDTLDFAVMAERIGDAGWTPERTAFFMLWMAANGVGLREWESMIGRNYLPGAASRDWTNF